MSEHLFEIDDVGRSLIPMGDNSFIDNGTYKKNFGENSGPADPPPRGVSCGGDWYLCKYANMPILDDGGLLRMTDNCVRLTPLSVKRGEPTSLNGGLINHTGKYNWITHYDYIDLSLEGDKAYFSPSDIANLLTKQLHKPDDIYKSWDMENGGGGRYEGGQWANSAGKYPMNSLFRQIHGPSDMSGAGEDPSSSDNINLRDDASGMLYGKYHEGDFSFDLDMSQEIINNGINAYGWTGGRLMGFSDGAHYTAPLPAEMTAPKSGRHKVWITNNIATLNTIPSTDSYNVVGYYPSQRTASATVRTFIDDTDYRSASVNVNVNYKASSSFGPMFIGTNNAQLSFNTDVSRFEWKFLHQGLYSEYSQDSSGNTSGGNIVAKIWGQAIQGYDNWDRVGGINVVNWCCPNLERDSYKTRRDSKAQEVLTEQDPIGLAFLNKLGFSANWIATNQGSTDYADCATNSYTKCYQPLGTTRSDYDVSESRPYTQPNILIQQSNRVGGFRSQYNAPPGTGSTDADYASQIDYLVTDTTKQTLGGMPNDGERASYNGSAPFGAEVITPTPATGNITLTEIGATVGYGMVSTLATPPSTIYKKSNVTAYNQGSKVPTALNLDDVKFPNYEVEVDSSSLLADELPKKTLIGYFLIMSDIIDKHEFIGSANGGQPLKCIGILSKNYENNDFYFSFQSPVEFHVKQDRTITSIRTVVVQPDLKDPAGLDYNSSIIYSIVRQQSLPEPDVPPISVQQALDYETMEQMTNQLGVDMKLFNPLSAVGQMGIGNAGGASLNGLRQNLVSAVLNPTQNSASMIGATETAMSSVVGRMPIHERARAILGAGMGDPSEALKPSPAQQSMEGLGIAQPNSLAPSPYLSEAQLNIEAFNLVKGGGGAKGPPDSGAGTSIGGSARMEDFVGGGQVPMDATADDDDMGSIKSAQTKDNELYSQIDPEESGLSATQTFLGGSKEGSLPAVSLPEFFSKYMNVANEATRQGYREEAKSNGFSVDNPNVWRLGMLRHWVGKSGKFDNFNKGLYSKIGATLNLEAKTKLRMAKARYEALDLPAQKAQRGKEMEDIKARGKDATELSIPEPKFGQEQLLDRVSRSQPQDTRTRADQKSFGQTDWKGQNPYDLHTWSAGNLKAYSYDLHWGIPLKGRTPDNKLSETGEKKIRAEQERRTEGGKKLRAIGLKETGEYRNKKHEPKGYDPLNKHLNPHPNIQHKHKMRFKVKSSPLATVAEAPTPLPIQAPVVAPAPAQRITSSEV